MMTKTSPLMLGMATSWSKCNDWLKMFHSKSRRMIYGVIIKTLSIMQRIIKMFKSMRNKQNKVCLYHWFVKVESKVLMLLISH